MDTKKPDQETRRKILLRYVAIGGLATVILVCLKLFAEHTSVGKEYELWVFGQLQNTLSSIDPNNPVVVLDISGLPGGKPNEPTPRKPLREIIHALSELEPKPRAIAVDVNFSPRGIHYSSPDDEEFFDFCLSVTEHKKVPVFLAVAETKSAPPEAWLGNALYKKLAVAAAADKYDMTHLPLWVKSSKSAEKLNMLNYALALEYRKQLPDANPWIAWAVETHVEHDAHDAEHEASIANEVVLAYQDRLVNYSKLDQLKEGAAPDVTADSIKRAAAKYSSKLVILGDLASADRVPVPGRLVNEPGSLVLASATYTLVKEPLFEFKWWVRLGLDFLIAGLIVVAVAFIRRRSRDASWMGKQAVFVYAAVLVVWLAGWRLVSWAGVLWLDFLLVALALLLHPKTEHLVDRVLEKLRKRPAPVVKTACVILSLLAMSGELSAQEGLFLPAPCDQTVAAVGLKLTTPKSKGKNKKVRTCYLRESKDAQKQALTERNVQRQYRAGQYLACDSDCSVTLYFCGTHTQEPINKQLPGWYPIIHAFSAPAPWNDSKPDNLLRKAQLYSPENPRLSDERMVVAAAVPLISIYGFKGERSGRIVSGVKESVAERKVSAEKPTATEASSAGDTSLKQFLEALEKGNVARKEKAYALAQEHYLAAQKARPEDYRGFQGLGNVFIDEKDWTAAEQALRSALKLEPLNGEVNLSLAFVLLQPMIASGDYTKASEVEQLLNIASLTKPNDQKIYDLYEHLLERQAVDLKQTEVIFRRALLYAPGSSEVNLRLARLLYRLDRSAEALTYVQQAEKSAYREQLLAVAKMYEVHGRYKDAERVLQTARKAMPRNATVLYNLGSVLVQRKHYQSALTVLKTTLELDQHAFAPALAYGIAHFGKGDLAGAETSLDQASLNVGQNADGLQRVAYWFSALGDAYSAKRKTADAIRVYEKSIIHAENPEVRERLLKMKQKRDTMQKRDAQTP